MNLCLSDQVLTGAIAGAVSVALAWIGVTRTLPRLIHPPRRNRRVTDHDHTADG